MIQQGLVLFDRLIVAIGNNPSKNYTFSVQERAQLLEKSTPPDDSLSVEYFDNRYLVDYAKEQGALYILRGIRSPSDFEYERVMRHINNDLAPTITTVFLMPPRELSQVSSSMVESLIGPNGWEQTVKRYVPAPVFEALKARRPRSNAESGDAR